MLFRTHFHNIAEEEDAEVLGLLAQALTETITEHGFSGLTQLLQEWSNSVRASEFNTITLNDMSLSVDNLYSRLVLKDDTR